MAWEQQGAAELEIMARQKELCPGYLGQRQLQPELEGRMFGEMPENMGRGVSTAGDY